MNGLNLKDNNDQNNQLLELFLKEIDSQNAMERVACIKRLGQMDIQVQNIPIIFHTKLENALLDSVAEVRKEAIMALAFLEGEIALPLIHPLLDDPIVRSDVLSALGYIGVCPPLDVINKMVALLHAPEDEIRDRCARTLGRLKISQAKNHLLRLAREDSSPSVRGGAVVALGMLEQGDHQLKSEITRLLVTETSAPVISVLRETLALIDSQLNQAEKV